VARYGGDEFAVITSLEDPAEIALRAESLCRAVESFEALQSLNVPGGSVTISIGCATMAPSDEASFERLLEEADQAMFEAKKAGRNRAVLREL